MVENLVIIFGIGITHHKLNSEAKAIFHLIVCLCETLESKSSKVI